MTARSNRVRHMPQRRDAIHIVREQRSPRWKLVVMRLGTAVALALFWGACMYGVVRHAL